jgi:hypothetical protein
MKCVTKRLNAGESRSASAMAKPIEIPSIFEVLQRGEIKAGYGRIGQEGRKL